MISGLHVDECDGAHIIPAKICMELNKTQYSGLSWQAIMQNPDNGLLLCKNLHWSFDGFQWTFDIFDLKIGNHSINQLPKYSLPLIVKDPRLKTTVSLHQRDAEGELVYYQIHPESLPYLLIHYHVYLLVNNHQPTKPSRNQSLMIDLYYRALQNFKMNLKEFLVHLEQTRSIDSGFSSSTKVLAGIWDYSAERDEFLVLYWGNAWKDRKWVSRQTLPDIECAYFEENLSEISDPVYKKRKIDSLEIID